MNLTIRLIGNSKLSLDFQLPEIPVQGLLATFCAVASCAGNGGNGVCAQVWLVDSFSLCPLVVLVTSIGHHSILVTRIRWARALRADSVPLCGCHPSSSVFPTVRRVVWGRD